MKRSAGNGGHGAEQDERGNKMKARQYFEKHRQEMTCGDEKKVQAAINQLVLELNDEAKDLIYRLDEAEQKRIETGGTEK